MKLRTLPMIALTSLLLSCTSHSGTNEYAEVHRQMWLRVSESEFPLPTTTPYDSTPTKRDNYLKGYAYGVKEQLRQFRTGDIILGDRIPPDEQQKPFADGERDGQLAVLTRADLIAEALKVDQQKQMKSQPRGGGYGSPAAGSPSPHR